MVEFLKKNCLYIIGVLFALTCLQTCRSCTKSNELEWTGVETTQKLDTLNSKLKQETRRADSLQAVVDQKEVVIEGLRGTVKRLEGDKTYLQETTNKLNSNLKKSLDKNEEPK